MKYPKLKDVLMTQDMGEKNADKICNEVLAGTFDETKDPISAIIVSAFVNNGYIEYADMATDLQYAINQLNRALIQIQNHEKDT